VEEDEMAARRAKPAKAKPARPKTTRAKAKRKPAQARRTPRTRGPLGGGSRFPAFSLPDQDGNAVALTDLLGQPFVLYFYPKDNTPGCTREACGFRDAAAGFNRISVRVIGVSPDSAASHRRFREQHGLSFTLLSDTDRKLARASGTWVKKVRYGRESMGIERTTFLVGADGVVDRVWRGVSVDGHAAEVLTAVQALA
jgi:peroxiredoxin Q/BCP